MPWGRSRQLRPDACPVASHVCRRVAQKESSIVRHEGRPLCKERRTRGTANFSLPSPAFTIRNELHDITVTYGNLNRKNQRMVEMASSKFSPMFDFRDLNVTLQAPRHQSPDTENRKHSGRDADTCTPLGGVSRSRVDTRSASILMRATRKSRTRWQNYQRSISSSDLRQLGTMEPR